MAEVRISNFSSLYFQRPGENPNPLPSEGWQLGRQQQECFMPEYLPSDIIRVQYSTYSDSGEVILVLEDLDAGTEELLSPVLIYESEDGSKKAFDLVITELPTGTYRIRVCYNSVEADPFLESFFCIVDEDPYSLLFSYTNYRNEFNTIFDGIEFHLRLKASFVPSEVTPAISSNMFRDQRYRLKLLSAFPYASHTLTVGGDYGVPNWVAEKLSLIFSTTAVTINDTPYVKGEDAALEATPIHPGVARFIYKIVLEPEDVFSTTIRLADAVLLATEDNRLVKTETGDYFIDMSFFYG